MAAISIDSIDLEKVMQAAYWHSHKTELQELCRKVMLSNGAAGPISNNVPVPDSSIHSAITNITAALS